MRVDPEKLSEYLESEFNKEREKRLVFVKEMKAENQTEYIKNLIWRHHCNGRDDLVETVLDGYINRAARRYKVKEHKPQRMSKQDCIQYLKMENDGIIKLTKDVK